MATKTTRKQAQNTAEVAAVVDVQAIEAEAIEASPTAPKPSSKTSAKRTAKTSTIAPSPARKVEEAQADEVICAVCSKPIGTKQPRTKNAEGLPIHIHHSATPGAPTKAKPNKPCKQCEREGVAEPSRNTFFTVGTRKAEGARKQQMVNSYLCLQHILTTDWFSGPRFIGAAPELPSPKKSRKPATQKASA